MNCIKMGSDEGHFNVALMVRYKVTRQCPQTTFEEKGEPKRYRTEVLPLTSLPTALPLGQTGSQTLGPCCPTRIAVSTHSEHRFPAPPSKLCKKDVVNQCLEFAVSSVILPAAWAGGEKKRGRKRQRDLSLIHI